MLTAKLKYLRIKLNEGKAISLHDINLLDDAASYIRRLEDDLALFQGELDLITTSLLKWKLESIKKESGEAATGKGE